MQGETERLCKTLDTVYDFSTKPRVFVPADCIGCKTTFTRESFLVDHLQQNKECMNAMGGNLEDKRLTSL